MRSLLDVNVLIALLDADHTSHRTALDWFEKHARRGWASCPLTQNGCLRIMSHSGYPGPLPVDQIVRRLREATRDRTHTFWPDDCSLLDERLIDATRIHGPRQVTDVYLLALAVTHGGRLVTFDKSVSIAAVPDAKSQHVLVL